MRAAYDALPQDERRRLEGLRTVNTLDTDHHDTRAEDRDQFSGPFIHPMVRTHPLHGSKAVYFHAGKTTIEGMEPEAGKVLMSDLLERMIRPDIVYTLNWRKGDVLVIDDRARCIVHTGITTGARAGSCGGSSSKETGRDWRDAVTNHTGTQERAAR